MKKLVTCNIQKSFWVKKQEFAALCGVSLSIGAGECVGLVGESGCGKSTFARVLCGLMEPNGGEILLDGQALGTKRSKQDRKKMQMVFQTPVDSFDPRVSLGKSIGEPMKNFGRRDVKKEVLKLLDTVGLNSSYYDKYPKEVSGGECQRAGIARAISVYPELLILDEATSALDVSVQAEILELLKQLQRERKMSYLFISHDLAVVQELCQRIYVMERGKIVEEGLVSQVLEHPKQRYTKRLLASVLPVDPREKWEMCELEEEDD